MWLTVAIHVAVSRQSTHNRTKSNLYCLLKAVLKMFCSPGLLPEQDSEPQWDPDIAGGYSSLREAHVLSMPVGSEYTAQETAFWLWSELFRRHSNTGDTCLLPKLLKEQSSSQPNASRSPFYDLTLDQANWWYKSSSPHPGNYDCVRFLSCPIVIMA